MPRDLKLTARVTVPDDMDDAEAARLVQRLIDSGEEEVRLSLKHKDFDDPDAARAAALGAVTVDGATGDAR